MDNNQKNNIINLFKFDIYINNDEQEQINLDIIKLLTSQKSSNDGSQISNVGGFQTIPLPMEDNYKAFIKKHISNYIKNYKMHKKIKTVEVVGDHFWINENNYSNYNILHSHLGNSISLSGIYYVKHPLKSGKLGFYNTNHEGTSLPFIFEGFDTYNWLDVKEGDFLLFPSSYRHCVGPNLSDENRISISFNLNLIANLHDD